MRQTNLEELIASPPRRSFAKGWFASACALFAICVAAPAFANTYTVGFSGSCTHNSISAALTAAENHAGADTIRITRSLAYNQAAIVFTTSQELTITGGFSDCNSAEDATNTTLDGTGGSATSVLHIEANTGALIRLRKLTITHGDVAGSNRGGGILFRGDGVLDIGNSVITQNEAGYGGGIAAIGTGPNAKLYLRAGTTVGFNTAHYSGGGMHLEDLQTVVAEDQTWIDFNEAQSTGGSGGYGGGVDVRACHRPSILYLGSPGLGGAGVVYGNSARYGGGVVLDGGDGCTDNQAAQLRMYSTNSTRLTKIEANTASIAGGGVYTHDYESTFSGYSRSDVYVWNASIVSNSAPQGAALLLDSDGVIYSNAYFNSSSSSVPPRPAGAVDCPFGDSCGRIDDNISDDDGRVISGTVNNGLEISRMELSGNHGSELVRLEYMTIDDTLMVDNEATARLIQTANLVLSDSTIAGNSIGAAETIGVDDSAEMHGLIIWQPGKTSLSYPHDPNASLIHDILANEITSLFNLTVVRLLQQDPRFVDPAHGDYSLTAGSPAVDFSAAGNGDDRDAYSHTRNIDFALIPNRYGPRDLGALEREHVQPIVLNGNFDDDLNHWDLAQVDGSTWDATLDYAGAADSGSFKMHLVPSSNGQTIHPRVQCVHIPGPGTYVLNGFGLSAGPISAQRDSVSLKWEYRAYGDYTENCSAGNPTQSGEFTITNAATWKASDQPAYIQIPASEWTRFSTVKVYPGATEYQFSPGTPAINAWIDNISLVPLEDAIFANGFEP